MNAIESVVPARDALLGSLVADAAGLGLHWIYSQGKIAQVVRANNDSAEFLPPDPANYAGVPSFYAHPLKGPGDSTQYGEYLYLALRATSAQGFDPARFLRELRAHFGPGGTYVGYIDTPARETLFNVAAMGKQIHAQLLRTPSSLDDRQRADAAHYIAQYYFDYDLAALKAQIRVPLKLKEWGAAQLAEVDRLVDLVAGELGATGPDDDQLPALTRSAVPAHFYSDAELDQMIDRAVRITNNNDRAVRYALFLARVLRELYCARVAGIGVAPAQVTLPMTTLPAATLRAAIEGHLAVLDADARALVAEAVSHRSLDYRTVAKRFGVACHLSMGVPLALHILLNTTTYSEAVRINTLAGGDNCGRAMVVGAIAGVLYGVGGATGIPPAWIERCSIVERARATTGGSILL